MLVQAAVRNARPKRRALRCVCRLLFRIGDAGMQAAAHHGEIAPAAHAMSPAATTVLASAWLAAIWRLAALLAGQARVAVQPHGLLAMDDGGISAGPDGHAALAARDVGRGGAEVLPCRQFDIAHRADGAAHLLGAVLQAHLARRIGRMLAARSGHRSPGVRSRPACTRVVPPWLWLSMTAPTRIAVAPARHLQRAAASRRCARHRPRPPGR